MATINTASVPRTWTFRLLAVWSALVTVAAVLMVVDDLTKAVPLDDHVTVVQVTPERNCARPLVPC